MKKLFNCMLLFCLSIFAVEAYAQIGQTVSGTIVDSDGIPVPGANIIEKENALHGATTAPDGTFSFELTTKDAVLIISYIGYNTIEVPVVGTKPIDVKLTTDATGLDEVVVIGYGVQKKKLVTGATSQVDSEDLVNQSSAGLFNSMQSKVTGVVFSASSGMPGEAEKVTIRGVGTIGNSSPLYVIDGVAGADFALVNAADIESIDILKDAASAAIYGSRAANGVILVTTKRGKKGRVDVRYDGYYAIQSIAKRVEMCNAQEYMEMYEEFQASSNIDWKWDPYLPEYVLEDLNNGWEGTDWFDEMANDNAPMQNHSLTVSGGNDMTRYSIGYTYLTQDGIFGAKAEPNMTRHNLRANIDNVLIKKDDRDVLSLNTNIIYSYGETNTVRVGSRYNGDIQSAMMSCPLMPMYDQEGNYYDTASKQREGWVFSEFAWNPMALMDYQANNEKKFSRLFGNASLNFQPIENLTIKSSLGYKTNTYFYRKFTPEYNLAGETQNLKETVTQTANQDHAWTWENTANYNFDINGGHAFNVVLGQSLEKSGMGQQLSATNTGMTMKQEYAYGWLNNTSGVDAAVTKTQGFPFVNNMLASAFARVIYDYKETYLFTAMMRADGSSRFAEGNRWGYFPSVSAGWVMSNEKFMQGSQNWLDFLKIRASWGQNGNCNIANFQYLSTVAYSADGKYYQGTDKANMMPGAYATMMANPDVTWETSEQLDLGFDATFFDSRLSATFDAYSKTTKDWLVAAPISGSYGVNAPLINGGDVQNRGLELGLSWRDKAGDLNYSISLNGSYNENEVLRIANASGCINGSGDVLDQHTVYMYRAEEGMPIGYYYGYKTDGIFQTQEQVDNTEAKLSGTAPGDFVFQDLNKDGAITEADKTMIGNPFPDLTGGFNISLDYKGWDLAIVGKYAVGNQVAQAYRRETNKDYYNWTKYAYDNRWTGEGTSNVYPRLGGITNFKEVSDYYIHDADYLKIQNITLGYDLKKAWKNAPAKKIRVYASLQNWFTFTEYNGFDPEVGYGGPDGWSSGIDVGFYPSARSMVVGANISF